MEETNLAPEAGLEAAAAISYQKGCYIGQEVIARIRTYGQVNKSLRGLRLPPGLAAALPAHGTKLFREGREVGYVTTAVNSPLFAAPIALGYVRRECNEPGTVLDLQVAGAVHPVEVSALPFVASPPPLP